MKALRYFLAWVRRGWWKLRGWDTLALPEEADERASICAPCIYNKNGTCSLCGCPIEEKVWWTSEICPKRYWPRIKRATTPEEVNTI